MKNVFRDVVEDFGEEWTLYDYSKNQKENKFLFNKYFDIFPKKINTKNLKCLDIGCGSGRFGRVLASKVNHLTLIDPSIKALKVAKKNLQKYKNVTFLNRSVSSMNLKKKSFNFIYSLGVLHHVPNIDLALKDIYKILKEDGFFLIYLYYNFDNKPFYYKIIWQLSEILRFFICRLPFFIKKKICLLITIFVYLPIVSFSKLLKKINLNIDFIPLSQYHDKSFYVMKTDTLDRFGTRYESRFSKKQIELKLKKVGFKKIIFSNQEPYWHAIAWKNLKTKSNKTFK